MCRWGGANAQMTAAVAEVDQMRYSYLVGLLCDLGLPTHAANDRAVLLTWAFIGRSFVPAFVAETSNSVAHDICADLLSNPKEELHVTFSPKIWPRRALVPAWFPNRRASTYGWANLSICQSDRLTLFCREIQSTVI